MVRASVMDLSNIRETDAIAEVVRIFEDETSFTLMER